MTSTRKGSADKTIPHTRLEDEAMIWEGYENIKKLGEGSFGKVYQVRHRSTDIHWAMKFINKDKAGGSGIKLMEREVTILKRVSHPNIIQLNEVFETSKRMYLVMELCSAGELADTLKERKHFMESEVKVITKELASAIHYLHKHDIVHRDIKLENILVSNLPDATNPEDRLQIKVTDFGLSITKSGVSHDDMMQDFCGTPNYMAPEIIDNKTYSQQCDVWALGVIVYTLFCGNPPFRSKDEESLYDLIKKGEIDFESSDLWKEVSSEAKSCISGMLNVDPAHRLTAGEILSHHWITGEEGNNNTNVLQLMRDWKNDLKIDGSGSEEENEEKPEGDKSAINGQDGPPEVKQGEEQTTEETNNNEANTSTEVNRKGSGGTKKPGSGGKTSTRNSGGRSSYGNIPKTTGNSLKVGNTAPRQANSRSPMPSKVSGSGTGSTRTTSTTPRQGTSTPGLRPTATPSKLNPGPRPTTKGAVKK
ncbi:serine/threonine-protein kinase 33-like [Mya arenaria]|uniref:serine/threonine-protein kinase 33-like n=1 Tax=Mya arenaria TaxID=6604 RepID=UPI0022E29F1B|nr:serine/threonine-protein kinase 33-like [Mya arenaria]XP_052811119.1 serine/threonine-protein kinase 33-like [Mya arenaria]